jgi:hypothetical protein
MSESEQACIDIYEDFDESEVTKMPSSITSAWYIGKELKQK